MAVRRRLAAGLATGLIALICAACGAAQHRTSRGDGIPSLGTGGRFAGYLWRGPVRTTAAGWRVPAIASGSPTGAASTWVAAISETPAGEPGRFPFIQIGTMEERRADLIGASDVYAAFWSDTQRGFHPILLFPVRPGDVISASLTLSGGLWRLGIADRSQHRSHTFSTPEETGMAFNGAEWLQEDVTSTKTGQALPYPRLSITHMTGVRIDGEIPSGTALSSSWLQVDGGYLGPGPLREDGFSDLPVHLSEPGERYLKIVVPFNDATSTLAAQLAADLSHPVPAAVLSRQMSVFLSTSARANAALAAGHWPADVATLIHREAATHLAADAALRRATRHGVGAILAVLAGENRSTGVASVPLIHQRLGLPGQIT